MPFQAALSSAPGIRGMPIPSYLSIYESFCRKPEHIRSLSDAYAHCWTDILFRYMDSHLQAHGLPLHQHAGSPAGIQPLPADIRHRPVHIPAHIRHHSAHIRYFHMLPLLISFRCIFRLSVFFLLFIGTVSFICSIIFLCTIRFFFLFCISLSCFYRCRLFFHCLFLS